MYVETTHRTVPRTGRSGSFALELLLLLPVVLGVLFAIVYFAVMVATQQQLMAASAEGARVASRGGAEDDVKKAVERVLGKGRLSQAKTFVNFEDKEGRRLESGDPIEVKVKIKTDCVFPNILAFLGVGTENDTLVGRSIRQLE